MRLNAPKGYHWTDEDVRYEKVDSFYSGVILGTVASGVVALLCLAFGGLGLLLACLALGAAGLGLLVSEFVVALYDYLASTSDPEEET